MLNTRKTAPKTQLEAIAIAQVRRYQHEERHEDHYMWQKMVEECEMDFTRRLREQAEIFIRAGLPKDVAVSAALQVVRND